MHMIWGYDTCICGTAFPRGEMLGCGVVAGGSMHVTSCMNAVDVYLTALVCACVRAPSSCSFWCTTPWTLPPQRLRTPHLRIRFAQGTIQKFLGDVNATQEEVCINGSLMHVTYMHTFAVHASLFAVSGAYTKSLAKEAGPPKRRAAAL